MEDFKSLDLPADLLAALDKMKYDKPTPIQAQAIPLALAGRDVLGSAQTGTGKTAAFSIPLIAKLMTTSKGSAIIMTPTRELAAQITTIIKQLLAEQSAIKTALLIGGENISGQMKQLQKRPRVIVGTPGRINDHLQRGSLKLHDANFLVLDETDRMLDMGFGIQLDAILPYISRNRQTLLFSATLPPAILKLAKKYTTDAERVSVGETNKVALKIKQEAVHLPETEKYTRLCHELDERTGSVVLFIKTKHGCDKMAMRLRKSGFEAEAIHGDLRQNKRDKVIKQFRDGKFRVLVATDVASRGLDIPHIMHVINFDLPQVAEDYIHRIGRTARNDAEGEALCLISPRDAGLWRDIQKLLDPEAGKNAKHTSSTKKPSNSKNKRKGDRFESKGGRGNGKPAHRKGDDKFGEKPKFGDKPKKKPFKANGEKRDENSDEPKGKNVTRNSRGKPTGDFKRAKPENKERGEATENKGERKPFERTNSTKPKNGNDGGGSFKRRKKA